MATSPSLSYSQIVGISKQYLWNRFVFNNACAYIFFGSLIIRQGSSVIVYQNSIVVRTIIKFQGMKFQKQEQSHGVTIVLCENKCAKLLFI